MNNAVIQIGVVGVGDMGSQHARNLVHHVAGARVSAVMDVDPNRLQTVAAECGGSKTYRDAHELIADDEVEAVIIATPDHTHTELTLACLTANKPVLCEKPLATNAADAEKVFRAEVAKGKRLVQVGFMREYDPPHQKIKAALQAGEIGPPLLFRGFHYNMTKGFDRHVNEVITNSAIHDIHSAHWLMAQEIVKVYAQYMPNNPDRPETCRLLTLDLTFRDGSLGYIQVNSESGYGYEVIVDITTEAGQVTTNSLTSPYIRHKGGLRQTIEPDWLARFDTAYLNELNAWSKAVLSDDFNGPSAWDGYTSLVVADACKQSARSGQAEVVRLVDKPSFYRDR